MITSNIHKRINDRKPNEFLGEQIKRTPSKLNEILSKHKQLELTRLLSKQKELKKENKSLDELADKNGTTAVHLTIDYIKHENMLFREFYEQIREKILPIMDSKLKELDKLDENGKEHIQYKQIKAYIGAIHTGLRNAPYRGGIPNRLSIEYGENLSKLCYEMENIKDINKETKKSLFELEMEASKIVNLYYHFINPKSSNWKIIKNLQKENTQYREIIMQQNQKEKLEHEKGPVIKLMKILANRFVEYNQKGALKDGFSSRFSTFLKMKFNSFDSLLEYLISDENPYRMPLLSHILGKEVAKFPENNQIMIIEKFKDFPDNNTDLNIFYYEYISNLYNHDIAKKLASHKNKRVREYLLYNDKLPKNFMFDEILPILKKDGNEYIKEYAEELYNTIL